MGTIKNTSHHDEEFGLMYEHEGLVWWAGSVSWQALKDSGVHHALGGSGGIFICRELKSGEMEIMCKCAGPDAAEMIFRALVGALKSGAIKP